MDLQDVLTIERDEAPDEDYFVSLQRAINSGSAWSFQGSMGRTMMAAIDAGVCMLGVQPARDFWGNHIPARTDVVEGTKGSRQFVVERQGEEWAAQLEAV